MDFLKCCFCFASSIGCRDFVSRKLGFHPPDPPGYKLSGSEQLKIVLVDDTGAVIEPLSVPWVDLKIEILRTKRNQSIPVVFLKNIHARFTVIYSHGNSTDLGLVLNSLIDLCLQLKVNILVYEYTGYGLSTGKASEKNLYSDIETAYEYLKKQNVHWSTVILYGQSLGSGPTCDLASKHPVGGVILHSPIASGLHLFSNMLLKTPKYDLFPNVNKVPYIKCPVFIIHGTQDDVVPVRHGEWLTELLHFSWPPWWVSGSGHNNIETNRRKEYLCKLKEFIQAIEELTELGSTEDELLTIFKPLDLDLDSSKLPPRLLNWPSSKVKPFSAVNSPKKRSFRRQTSVL